MALIKKARDKINIINAVFWFKIKWFSFLPILPITSGKNIRACAMLQLANQKQIKVSKENKTISE